MSIYTLRAGVSNHPERTVLAHLTDCVRQGGMIKIQDNSFKTQEQNTPAMGVIVKPGRAYLKGQNTNAYPVISTEIETLLIEANLASQPRIDLVILYLDLNALVEENNEGQNVAKLAIIKGQNADLPSAPAVNVITAQIGDVPYEKLAQIIIAANCTAINNEQITDLRRRTFMKTPRWIAEVPSAADLVLDYSEADHFEVKAKNNTTLNLPLNMEAGDCLMLNFIQDEVGNRTLAFDGNFKIMNNNLEVNNLPNKTTTYAIEKSHSDFKLYLAGREE